MSARTNLSLSVPNDRLDEVLNVLRSLAPDVGPGMVNRPGSDGSIGVTASLPGDVRDVVRERLDPLGLEYQVDVGELKDH